MRLIANYDERNVISRNRNDDPISMQCVHHRNSILCFGVALVYYQKVLNFFSLSVHYFDVKHCKWSFICRTLQFLYVCYWAYTHTFWHSVHSVFFFEKCMWRGWTDRYKIKEEKKPNSALQYMIWVNCHHCRVSIHSSIRELLDLELAHVHTYTDTHTHSI